MHCQSFTPCVRYAALFAIVWMAGACRSPQAHRDAADRRALAVVDDLRGHMDPEAAPLRIERPEDTLRRRLFDEQHLPRAGGESVPEGPPPSGVPSLSLVDALLVGAANSREYQDRKETVFRTALALDLEKETFRLTPAGALAGAYSDERGGETPRRGVVGSAETSLARTWAFGANMTSRLAVDLAKLLTLDRDAARGLLADVSITVPLLSGAGHGIVTEALTQAERNVLYALYDFERFKRSFAVEIASAYLSTLEQLQQIHNAEENYRRLLRSTERAEAMFRAGRLQGIQVDQSRQDELRARERLASARLAYRRQLDALKIALGLPPDARIELQPGELERLTGGDVAWGLDMEDEAPLDSGWRGIDEQTAVRIALAQRLDLRKTMERIEDAHRAVHVARDGLRAGMQLRADAAAGERRAVGSAGQGDARLDPGRGSYGARLELNLPWQRGPEQVRYRAALLDLERAQRDLEEMEDRVKSQTRSAMRNLARARESCRIQRRSISVAERRVESTLLFQQAGRAQIRDVLEAEEALLSARNAYTSALVAYRVAELELQRDMETLTVSDEGLWHENDPPLPAP